jgi:hypothetical protein
MKASEVELIWAKLLPHQRNSLDLACPHLWLPSRNTLIVAKKYVEIKDHEIVDFEKFTLREFYEFLTPGD